MMGLNVVMHSACQGSLFQGVKLPKDGLMISHLFYTDGALFVGDCFSFNFINLARMLRCFHASLHLKVSFQKSKVFGIRVSKNEVTNCARIIGYEATMIL